LPLKTENLSCAEPAEPAEQVDESYPTGIATWFASGAIVEESQQGSLAALL
jgi:hypothetical protein